jgi:hypothetical protein
VDHAVTGSLQEKAIALAGTWARPPDLPAKVAIVLAVGLALVAVTGWGRALFGVENEDEDKDEKYEHEHLLVNRTRFVFGAAMVAALLSVAYIAIYLKGGPRIVDATTYFLQGRALAEGDLAWQTLEPSASFRGRFLLYSSSASALGGIFPPGYPLVLAFGFLLGAPMVVGPIIAALLVVATYRLAHTVAAETDPALAEPMARTAVLLSIVCAALRYHTADTMSHGATALAVAVALDCALRSRAWLAGLAIGYVVATRPFSSLPIGLVAAALLARGRSPRGLVSIATAALGGMLPGVVLLLASQHAVTGSWLGSTQRMYYAVSDGPPDCFRWGFGQGIGCVFEHGDFVRARLEHGFGVVEATGATLRRLRDHLLDIANLEPLAPVVLVPLLRAPLRQRAVIAAGALVGLQILAYAPFYFDGDYPGGGARFFADVLPVEHVLLALAAVSLRAHRGGAAVVALALAGFAVHGAFEHGKLRDRDGGRPMFEPDVLAHASVKNGLVFVDTDHGFALGHDPGARPDREVVVARLRGDARDRMLYDALDRPPTYLYKLETNGETTATTPSLVPWAPSEPTAPLRFEAEAEWPPLAQEGGFAVPVWASRCTSGNRALVLTPTGPTGSARATIAVPVPRRGRWSVEVHVAQGATVPYAPAASSEEVRGVVTLAGHRFEWRPQAPCGVVGPEELDLEPPSAAATIEAIGGPVAVDDFLLKEVR